MQIELSIHNAEDIYEEFAAMWLLAYLSIKSPKPRPLAADDSIEKLGYLGVTCFRKYIQPLR